MDSDVDIGLLTTKKELYLGDESWVRELGGLRIVRTQECAPTTERWLIPPSEPEVEVGVAPPSWAATDPVDPGTRNVAGDGMSILYDPRGLLEQLAEACRETP